MFAYGTRTGMMQSLCDMHDAAIATLDACLPVARGRLDVTAVRRLIMHVQVLKNDLPAALDEGLSAIRLFGIDLPPFSDDDMLAAEMRTTLAMLDDRVARPDVDADASTEARTLAALTDLQPLQDAELAAQGPAHRHRDRTVFGGPENAGASVMSQALTTPSLLAQILGPLCPYFSPKYELPPVSARP